MSDKASNGGPAFPMRYKLGQENPDGSRSLYDIPGMSVRTWLVGQAIAGDGLGICLMDPKDVDPQKVAVRAVALADACLAELGLL